MFWEKTNPHNFRCYHRRCILVFIQLPIHWNEIPGPQCSSPWIKIHQAHFLVMIAPELSKENTNTKRRVGKNEPTGHIDNSFCHNGRKIWVYFARKTMMRALQLIDSPELSPVVFVLRLCKKRMEDQIITSEDDLQDKLTEVWETVNGDLLELVFYEWMSRAEWVI
jgi:hypothetical protein